MNKNWDREIFHLVPFICNKFYFCQQNNLAYLTNVKNLTDKISGALIIAIISALNTTEVVLSLSFPTSYWQLESVPLSCTTGL
jgi:hypothetical protein